MMNNTLEITDGVIPAPECKFSECDRLECSTAETLRIKPDEWRKMSSVEKEIWNQLAEWSGRTLETNNEKRLRDFE